VGLREEKKHRQRRAIVDAALTQFRKRGYDQTRVRDIIERVRISEATFFNYFPSKDSLLDELALAQVDVFSEILRYQLGADQKAVPERIRETMRTAAVAIAQDREFQAVLYTRSNLFHSSGVLKEQTHEMYRLLADLFAEGQARREIRGDVDPTQLAEILIANYRLITTNWLIGWWGTADSLETRMAAAVEVFLDGSRPRRKVARPR
jgi:AcrR family transcriptional regulator